MSRNLSTNSDLWRGALILPGFAALTMFVFLLFDYGGPWRLPTLPKPAATSRSATVERKTVAPAPQSQTRPPAPAVQAAAPVAAPAKTAQAHAAPAHAPSTAAEALRQVLSDYRADPNRTATVAISSSGRIAVDRRDALSVFDGLPAHSIDDGAVLTASGGTGR